MSRSGHLITFAYLKDIGILAPAAPRAAPAAAAPAAPAAATVPATAPAAAPPPAAVAATAPTPELTREQLEKMSKEERKAYHEARRAEGKAAPAAAAKGQLTKAQRQALQEAQRKAKADRQEADGKAKPAKKETGTDKQAGPLDISMLEELKSAGFSEEQAKQMMLEMEKVEDLEDDENEEEDEAADDLLASVRSWMAEQEGVTISADSLSDFMLKVRFQGHVDSTPPDHMRAILHVAIEQALAKCDLTAPKLQPTAVAKLTEPAVVRWAPLLKKMYDTIDDVLLGADVITGAVQEGVAAAQAGVPESGMACGIVGSLMAVREAEILEDEDLLTGCKRIEIRSKVIEKFIEFLEEELDDEDEDDEENGD